MKLLQNVGPRAALLGTLEQRIAVLKPTGSLGIREQRVAFGQAHQTIGRWRAPSYVLDSRNMICTLPVDDILRDAAQCVIGCGLSVPGGAVGAAEEQVAWRDYATVLAHRGVLRGVFTDFEVAQAWAALQAQIFNYDRRRIAASER